MEDFVKEKNYVEVAQSLAVRSHNFPGKSPNLQFIQAVKQISATFKQYTAIQRVAEVWKRIQEIQGSLRSQIDADFDTL